MTGLLSRGLICTTCGTEDCRSGRCNSPMQRHVTREEWDQEKAAAIRGLLGDVSKREALIGPERERVRMVRRELDALGRALDPNSEAGAGLRKCIGALDELFDTLAVDRSAFAALMTPEELQERDQDVRYKIKGIRVVSTEEWCR